MKSREPIYHIWSNYDLNLEDWIDGIKERFDECGVDYSDWDENKFYEEMVEENDLYFEDEKCNLNIPTEGRIVCIADVGLWNGRRMGYKLYGHNIKECLEFFEGCDYADFYVDRYDFRCKQTHHDGSHFCTFREFKPNISSDQADNFLWKIYNGTVTKKDITRYTRSLAPYIKKVYWWT
jgi:hypothetical protein